MFTALAAEDLPLASYVGLLRSLAIVYADLEAALASVPDTAVRSVWDDAWRRLPTLHQDLAHFQAHTFTETPVAELHAQVVAQQIRQRAVADPRSLLGYLYVFEGSSLGGSILRRQVVASFGLTPTSGLAYLSSHAAAPTAQWREFGGRMGKAPITATEQDRLVASAREAFTGMGQIVRALYPLAPEPRQQLVQALNPLAGTHPIPDDGREIQAALRAGEHTWREFPYYAWRYGARGEQFTRSDSAWLVTLAQHDEAIVTHQVRWLGRVLASRGMPQWLLELHLEVLHGELVAAVPERQAEYDRLRHASTMLRSMRHAHIDEAQFQELIAAFDQQVGPEWSMRLPRTGGLLASAVADERAGIRQAVPSIAEWMIDPTRFPEEWREAVSVTIEKARAGELGSMGRDARRVSSPQSALVAPGNYVLGLSQAVQATAQ